MYTLQPPARLQELTIVANFCEVLLAKQGHDGPVGINYLRKIELPLPFGLLGAMLAGVDYVLVGAGNPAEIPALLRSLARHNDVVLDVRAQGATSADTDISVRCSPRELLGTGLPPLRRPRFLAIVASHDLAAGLEHKGGRAANTEGRRCVCNALLATALLATAGLPQHRPNGNEEPPSSPPATTSPPSPR